MTKLFTPQLGREVEVRQHTIDEETWIDTFTIGYHVPPAIEPRYVLDLGANIGLTAAHYQTLWPEAQIVAVEMDADNAELCRQNFSGIVVNAAVGLRAGDASYSLEDNASAYSLLHPGEASVRVLTISQILDDCLPGADEVFCKMDVEGTEWDIFSEELDSRIKWLLVELHRNETSNTNLKRAKKILEHQGFSVDRHRIHPHALWASR